MQIQRIGVTVLITERGILAIGICIAVGKSRTKGCLQMNYLVGRLQNGLVSSSECSVGRNVVSESFKIHFGMAIGSSSGIRCSERFGCRAAESLEERFRHGAESE